MLALEQHGGSGGEHLERRHSHIVEARDGPAVPAVGIDEPLDIGALRPGAHEDVADVDPALVALGAIVGGRYSSQRGSTAKRLITSRAAAAFPSGIVSRPISRVWIPRLPSTSSMSSCSSGRVPPAGAAGSSRKGFAGS
jgi:hypothetical protein